MQLCGIRIRILVRAMLYLDQIFGGKQTHVSGVLSPREDAGRALSACKPVLVHDPVSLGAGRRLPAVEDQDLLHPHHLTEAGGRDRLVLAGGLPVTRPGRPVRPVPRRVLGLLQIEQVPLLLTSACEPESP